MQVTEGSTTCSDKQFTCSGEAVPPKVTGFGKLHFPIPTGKVQIIAQAEEILGDIIPTNLFIQTNKSKWHLENPKMAA